ncbi:UbiA family prenyltransferase [Streptomyces niveus]|uniref:UbiA family prenyltransferase n=1 Tax=Streptomyces niveus TaxID=193462 RepID=UPI003688F98D
MTPTTRRGAAPGVTGPRRLVGQGLRAWAELLRVSALFTVPGDALAGAASVGVRPNRGTALAVGASLCLYEAGMALNDWADRDEDALERPHRPIPSGRITPNAALTAAGALTATGLFLASRAGRPTLALSTALAATVWAYDLRLKHTAAGPAAMGAARALDVLMGATATLSTSRRTGAGLPAAPATPVEASASEPAGSAAGRSRTAPSAVVPGDAPAPSERQGVLARLSAWAGGPARPGRTTAAWAGGPTEPFASRGATPPTDTDLAELLPSAWTGGSAVSTPRGAATGNGWGRTATPLETLASKLAGAASQPAVEAAASTARFPAPSAGRDLWAHVPRGRTGGPVEAFASRRAGPAWLVPTGVPRGALLSAALLGVHTLAVTTVSRREVYGGSVGAPVAALAVTGVLAGVVGRPRDPGVGAVVAGGLAAVYAGTAGRAFLHAALNPSPQLTQRAVGGGIRAMIPFQAALAARGGAPGIGLAVMGLVPLARKLAKRVSVT